MMTEGIVRVAAATPEIVVGDCRHNGSEIIRLMKEADMAGCLLTVFPELSVTGYTCGDLFNQKLLLDSAFDELKHIAEETADLSMAACVGLPVTVNGKLYNCGAFLYKGQILGIVPKVNIPNYTEFYEGRYFTSYSMDEPSLWLDGIPFGHVLFDFSEIPGMTVGIEICEDLWVGDTPSNKLCAQGATVICNLSAGNEIIGKADYRRTIISAKSGSNACAYIYANAGSGESTTDAVYSGHRLIFENGSMLAESELFTGGLTIADIDVQLLMHERRRMNTFHSEISEEYVCCDILPKENESFMRVIPKTPFVPQNPELRNERCHSILTMQIEGLRKRIVHTHCKTCVIGISGGLDSTLALLVTAEACDKIGKPRADILAVTMPCFGTTDRTYHNAVSLCHSLGVTLKEIDIRASVQQHFTDIGQDPELHDVTYENSQARERTQILMDLANKTSGMVIGTGDLSEQALGWATYNGDHMSMYAVNTSIPKTLVRYLVEYYASSRGGKMGEILTDVLDTPVSPELLPPEDGKIAQKTEDIVGPYALHDFFLYYFLRFGYGPRKIYSFAKYAFHGEYEDSVIIKWLETFTRRFFSQQFKRSCVPDGPKVGSVTLSPRGDLRLPSDASSALWMAEIEKIKKELL